VWWASDFSLKQLINSFQEILEAVLWCQFQCTRGWEYMGVHKNIPASKELYSWAG
jgi:hypothetical protein